MRAQIILGILSAFTLAMLFIGLVYGLMTGNEFITCYSLIGLMCSFFLAALAISDPYQD